MNFYTRHHSQMIIYNQNQYVSSLLFPLHDLLFLMLAIFSASNLIVFAALIEINTFIASYSSTLWIVAKSRRMIFILLCSVKYNHICESRFQKWITSLAFRASFIQLAAVFYLFLFLDVLNLHIFEIALVVISSFTDSFKKLEIRIVNK